MPSPKRCLSCERAHHRSGQHHLAAMADSLALSGLLQLSSASLPIGAFSHSLGMEAAHGAGQLPDAAAVEAWILDFMAHAWARSDAPLWLAQFSAWQSHDARALQQHNAQLCALRDTAELRLENEQTARSLQQWLHSLGPDALDIDSLDLNARPTDQQRACLEAMQPLAFVSVHALAAERLQLNGPLGLQALGWSLLENLVMAAIKLLPLGQRAGQTLLRRLACQLPTWIDQAHGVSPSTVSSFTPMLSIHSAAHETQYSRLFRS